MRANESTHTFPNKSHTPRGAEFQARFIAFAVSDWNDSTYVPFAGTEGTTLPTRVTSTCEANHSYAKRGDRHYLRDRCHIRLRGRNIHLRCAAMLAWSEL